MGGGTQQPHVKCQSGMIEAVTVHQRTYLLHSKTQKMVQKSLVSLSGKNLQFGELFRSVIGRKEGSEEGQGAMKEGRKKVIRKERKSCTG